MIRGENGFRDSPLEYGFRDGLEYGFSNGPLEYGFSQTTQVRITWKS